MKTNEPVFDVNNFLTALGRNLVIVCTLVCYIAAIIMLLLTAIGVIGVLAGEWPALYVLVTLGVTAALAVMGAICDAIGAGFGVQLFGDEEEEDKHVCNQESEWD